MSKYRIVKWTYKSKEVRYQIQEKWLFWWIDIASEHWKSLEFAQQRLSFLEGGKIIISEEVVE